MVNLTTLLGLDQDPGEIPGVGPIPADEARELAADGSWRAWITDAATGQVIDTGRRSYTPSAALARLIRAREPYCRMVGCRRRAINCDLDHTIPWPTWSDRGIQPWTAVSSPPQVKDALRVRAPTRPGRTRHRPSRGRRNRPSGGQRQNRPDRDGPGPCPAASPTKTHPTHPSTPNRGRGWDTKWISRCVAATDIGVDTVGARVSAVVGTALGPCRSTWCAIGVDRLRESPRDRRWLGTVRGPCRRTVLLVLGSGRRLPEESR